MIQKIQSFFTNPNVQHTLSSMKPEKSLWGFIGIIVFFIIPEIVAFIYGAELTQYAKLGLENTTGAICTTALKMLVICIRNVSTYKKQYF
jgi:uncharacterized membrane protein